MSSRSADLAAALLALAVAVATVAPAFAHDDPYAVPSTRRFAAEPLARVPSLDLPALDRAALAREDALRDPWNTPPRFAVPIKANVNPQSAGLWESLDARTLVWRYRVRAKSAHSLNFGFTRFHMPPGGRLLLYSADGREQRGPFTAADNHAHGSLWTPVMFTDDAVIEVTVPRAARDSLELTLGQVGQGYRGFSTASDNPGACNLDVECLAPDEAWRTNAKAVGVISTGGSTFCSGSLLNDVPGNRKPLFVTAHHCGIDAGDAASLVVYWNYQNSTCREPGSPESGAPGDGSLSQYNTGAILRADYAPSDFTLVELDDPVDPAFDVYWAGWNRTAWQSPGGEGHGDFDCAPTDDPSDPPGTGACATIHHPSDYEKRITFATTPTTTTSDSGRVVPGDGSHLWVHWSSAPPYYPDTPGVTEPGSSGSPFYDSSRRFVGQLHGGPSVCGATGDDLSDYYGRFSVSWPGGGNSETRASDWLDPLASGVVTLDGLGQCTAPQAPTGLMATTNRPNQIDLTWDPVAGASEYRVFRLLGGCPADGPTLLAEHVTGTSYSDHTVSGGSSYAYAVTAIDPLESCESSMSSCAQADADGACALPPAFAGVTDVASAGTDGCGAVLSWDPATPSCGGEIVYSVHRSASPGFAPTAANAVASCLTSTSYTDTTAPAGMALHYVVRAEEISGAPPSAGPCQKGVPDPNVIERSVTPGGPPTVLFSDDAESGGSGLAPGGSGPSATFSIVTSDSHSGSHSWFVPDTSSINDKQLAYTGSFALPSAPVTFDFWHRLVSEADYDGAVLEISTDGGSTWQDVLTGNPSRFVQGGYNGQISGDFSNPIGGRLAWHAAIGSAGKFVHVITDLTDFGGQSLRFRFRFGSDQSLGAVGWWIDDVTLSAAGSCTDPVIFSDGVETGDTSRWSAIKQGDDGGG